MLQEDLDTQQTEYAPPVSDIKLLNVIFKFIYTVKSLLLQNHMANFKQTWYQVIFGKIHSRFFYLHGKTAKLFIEIMFDSLKSSDSNPWSIVTNTLHKAFIRIKDFLPLLRERINIPVTLFVCPKYKAKIK